MNEKMKDRGWRFMRNLLHIVEAEVDTFYGQFEVKGLRRCYLILKLRIISSVVKAIISCVSLFHLIGASG